MEIIWVSDGDNLSAKKGSHRNGDCLRGSYSIFTTPGLRVIYLFLTPTSGATGITARVAGTAARVA